MQKLKRIYVSGAVECDVDDSGRILVPPTLREHAKLAKDVLWAGTGKYAELWDKGTWSDALRHDRRRARGRSARASRSSGYEPRGSGAMR